MTSPVPPELPLRSAAVGGAGRERHASVLAAPALAVLGRHAEDAGVTLDATLLAAFAEVLRTWAAQPDFSLGFRHADGRVVTVVAARGAGNFAERAASVGSQLMHPTTQSAEPPAYVFATTVQRTGDLAELVDVACRRGDDGLAVVWDVAAEAFPPGLVAAMAGAYQRLLGSLATIAQSWQLRRFDLVPDADRDLVARVNATTAEVPDHLLQDYLATVAARDPAAEAVVDGRRRLTYGELFSYANRIGRRLRSADATDAPVRPGELVAIVMEKGWEQYAAVYGVLTAGAAYLPIDASVPPERLARLLARGRARHVLTQSWLDEQLAWPEGVTRHRVDTEFDAGDDSPLPAAQEQTHPAYVILTSGSTGEPKGVTVDHRGVVNLVTDVNTRFGVNPADRLFAVSGLHFDASIYDVFGVIAAGATVVLPDPFTRAQPDRWVERVATESVTFWNSVPALMEMLVGHAEIREDRPLASLRLAVLSGDWIPLTLPDRLRDQAPGISVVGSGGPTETICWSLFYPIGEVDPAWRSIPYGKAIRNQRYYIVDDEWHQRPVHVVGEMAVASDVGLAIGYWDDEARTRERFVTLPQTGERAYLCGDLGRYLPDGNVEILGRDDFQVKIQGYRIELGEIEAALRENPVVEHAVVIAPPAGSGVRRLHAFVTTVAGASATEEDLRAALLQLLPAYLVPARIALLDALPLTQNGKVDRLTLTAWAKGEAPPVLATAPPTALEGLLAATIAEVLGLEAVGPTDNFFTLGGDSLGGIRVLRRLHELTEVNIPLRTLFDHPVVADLAVVLSADADYGPGLVAAAERLDALLAQTLAAQS